MEKGTVNTVVAQLLTILIINSMMNYLPNILKLLNYMTL